MAIFAFQAPSFGRGILKFLFGLLTIVIGVAIVSTSNGLLTDREARGRHIGGATETFDAFNQGELQTMLASSSVIFNHELNVDPYSLLPTWLHPR